MDAVKTLQRPIELPLAPRSVVLRTRGRARGGITRLVSPSDVGEFIKPFVFLDAFDVDPKHGPKFGWHPHSGIATLTYLLAGDVSYEDSTGAKGELHAGSLEWMRAGGGVWHTGSGLTPGKGFQLWISLPASLESVEAKSQYLPASAVPQVGPAKVLLGEHGGVRSLIDAPPGINYLGVELKAGERWRYVPPADHDVAWIALHRGALRAPEAVEEGELAVFAPGNDAIEFEAVADTGFVLGTAVKHPHDLVLGYYSVHTSAEALGAGEANIHRIGERLRAQGVVGK